jgi:hypothetical protein
MKTLLLLLLTLLLCTGNLKAQKSDSTRTQYWFYRGLSCHQTELKSKPHVKNGLFKLFNAHKVVAMGYYQDDQRIGKWTFVDRQDSISQIYNYSTKKVIYYRPNPEIVAVIKDLKAGDRAIYPVKVGGYLGLHFLTSFYKIPSRFKDRKGSFKITYAFKLNAEGILVGYTVTGKSTNYEQEDHIDLKLLKPEDFEFVPAIVNGKNVESIIYLERYFG